MAGFKAQDSGFPYMFLVFCSQNEVIAIDENKNGCMCYSCS